MTRVTILAYHGITEAPLPVADWCFITRSQFESQLDFLASRYPVVPLRDLPSLLQGDGSGKHFVAITFDDGMSTYRSIALPILAHHGFHSTVFVTTGAMGDGRPLWHARLLDAITRTRLKNLEWRGALFDLGDAGARAVASARLQKRLKTLHVNALEEAVDRLVADLLDGETGSAYPDHLVSMRAADIEALAGNDLVDIGAHTVRHAILSRLDPDEQRAEIEGSLRAVSNVTGRPCELFAYPNGAPTDFTPASRRLLAGAGVRVAVTTVGAAATRECDYLATPRYCVGGDIDRETFSATIGRLAGAR